MIHRIYESTQKSVRDFIKEKWGLEKPIKFWNGNFNCSYNQLTSLEGAPSEVGGYFWCSYNQLTTLEGAPKEVSGDFTCYNNKKQFTEEEVRAVCNVKGEIYI